MPHLNIERFTSWGEIFPNSADAERQYETLVGGLRDDYTANNSLLAEKTKIDPDTGLAITTFDRKPDGSTSIQRLQSGDVRLRFSAGSVIEIVPQVGNRRHDWTFDLVTSMQGVVTAFEEGTDDSRLAATLTLTSFYLKGKMAAVGWEEEMFRMGFLPQRIGYRIYPESVLQEAQRYFHQVR